MTFPDLLCMPKFFGMQRTQKVLWRTRKTVKRTLKRRCIEIFECFVCPPTTIADKSRKVCLKTTSSYLWIEHAFPAPNRHENEVCRQMTMAGVLHRSPDSSMQTLLFCTGGLARPQAGVWCNGVADGFMVVPFPVGIQVRWCSAGLRECVLDCDRGPVFGKCDAGEDNWHSSSMHATVVNFSFTAL